MSEVNYEPFEECRVIPRGSSWEEVKRARHAAVSRCLEELDERDDDREQEDEQVQ